MKRKMQIQEDKNFQKKSVFENALRKCSVLKAKLDNAKAEMRDAYLGTDEYKQLEVERKELQFYWNDKPVD